MRLLIVTPEYEPDAGGGIIAYYRALVPALRDHGCEVSVLKGSAVVHGLPSYRHDDVAVSVLETARFERWLEQFAHFAMFPELRRHLAAAFALHEQGRGGDGFDVVEVTDWGLLFLPWIISAKARVIVQLHGSCGQIARHEPIAGREAEGAVTLLIEKAALEAAPGLSSYSRANVRWWETILRRVVDYLPPPLKFPSAKGNGAASTEKWLVVGRIQQWKGPQLACAAWQMLGEYAPPLEWVGRDTTRGESGRSTAAWLSEEFPETWGKRIRPVGQLRSEEVAQRLSAAKALLVPSTWDVFNLAGAEAMASAKPVVISDSAGAVDLIQHGVNGFVFANGDTSALVECVRHVEQLDQNQLQTIGHSAASTVRERLDPMRIAEGKIALYRRLPDATSLENDWLREWLSPTTGRSPLKFLDGLPLKDISRYVARRGMRKIRSGDKP